MSGPFQFLTVTAVVSGRMCSLLLVNGEILADLEFVFHRSTACNGGGTGDIQYPGQGSTSPPGVNSVKCYAD